MYCTMYYFMLSCVVKTLFLKKEKKILKKKKKDFMLKGRSLFDYTNLLSSNDYEKNDKIILKYFQ